MLAKQQSFFHEVLAMWEALTSKFCVTLFRCFLVGCLCFPEVWMEFVVLDLPCGFGFSHLGRTSGGARPFEGVHEFCV